MAATLTRERFTGPEWVFERKLDGIRLLAFKSGRDVRLMTRNRLKRNELYPAYVEAVAALPVQDAILDGEATGMFGQRGVADGYHVFDVLWLDGDVTSRPLDERRNLLCALPLRSPLYIVARLEESRPWERACAEGWEGVIAKRRDSMYEHRRSPNWLKMKCEARHELVIGGFTEPRGKRVGFGALLVGYFDSDDFVFAGKVGTGLDTHLLLELRHRFAPLEITRAPFTKSVGLPKQAHWVRPEIVVEVAFMEWTSHGKLRHPRLVCIRDDMRAHEVIRSASASR